MEEVDGKFDGAETIDPTNLKDINKTRKYWLLTHYNNKLHRKKNILDIKEKLTKFPHLISFVFQIEKDDREHIHIAIEMDNTKSKPVRQFIKFFPKYIIECIKDINAGREYCSKKYSRLPDTKPLFHGLEDKEEKRLTTLGEKDRAIKLLTETKERKASMIVAKERDSEESDFDEVKEVKLVMDKANKEYNKEEKTSLSKEDAEIDLLMCKIDKRVKKLLNKIEDKKTKKSMTKLEKDIQSVINKWKENNAKLEKEKKDKKIAKTAAKIISDAAKAQSKIFEKLEKNIKQSKEEKESHKKSIEDLKKRKTKLFKKEIFSLSQLEAKVAKGEKLNYNEQDVHGKIKNIDAEIAKFSKSIKDSQQTAKESYNKLKKEDKTSATSHIPVSSDNELSESEDFSSDKEEILPCKFEDEKESGSPFKFRGTFEDMRKNKQLRYNQYDLDKKLAEQDTRHKKKLLRRANKYEKIIDDMKKEAIIKDKTIVVDKPRFKSEGNFTLKEII